MYLVYSMKDKIKEIMIFQVYGEDILNETGLA